MSSFRNWGDSILSSLSNALNLVLTFIPKLVGFLVILLLGCLVASGVSRAVAFLLHKVGFYRMAEHIGMVRLEQRLGIGLDPVEVLRKIVYWFVFLIFLVPAVDALGLTTVSNVLNTVIDYIPNVFVAVLVLFLGTLIGVFTGDRVQAIAANARIGNPFILGGITRWAIIGFAVLIALSQLQIAPSLINVLFTAVIGAVAIAFGLAFGLGGQETARRMLARSENAFSNAASWFGAQQSKSEVSTTSTAQTTPEQGRVKERGAAYQMGYSEPPNLPDMSPPSNRPGT